MATNSAKVTVSGTPKNPVFDFELPSGPKGEPGGWNIGTNLGTTDLDTVTTPGLYYQPSTNGALAVANHYPPMSDMGGSVRGILEVVSWSGGSSVVQRYTRIGTGGGTGTPTQRPRVTYVRYREQAWSEWSAQTTTRVDNTVGRAIYTWDDTANREQLLYGDTGWRDISNNLNPNFTCNKVTMRRSDYMVTINYDSVKSATESGHVIWYSPPLGFKPDISGEMGNLRYGLGTDLGGNNQKVVSPESASFGIRFLSYTAGLSLQGSFSYYTRDPWPTTAPGSAIGTAPHL